MITKETLFDRNLLRQNRWRCSKNFAQNNFLHHEVANRIAENVEFLNRNFEQVLEIAAFDDYLQSQVALGLEKKNSDLKMPNINWQKCESEELLPQEPESFDLILSNLNFHFINEIPQFLLQVKNLLKPNGVFIASFFGEENLSQLAHVLYETENEIYGGVSPRMPPTIDVKTAANLLAKASFKNAISDFSKIEVDYSEPLKLLKDLKNMAQGNILTKRSRKFFTKKFLNKISQNYQKNYSNHEGGVTATFEVLTVTGWKQEK